MGKPADMNRIFTDMNRIFLSFLPEMTRQSAIFPILLLLMSYYLLVSMRVERWDKPNFRLIFNIPLSATREENLSEGSGWYVNGMSTVCQRPGVQTPHLLQLVPVVWDSEAPWRASHAPAGGQGRRPGKCVA